jgi:LuxR family maltose regulon positive regulatory protein
MSAKNGNKGIVPNIIKTKLAAPRPPRHTVLRERLFAQLENDYRNVPHVSIVSAPPGFGKSTMVVQWIEEDKPAYGWLTLDTRDNDPLRFLLYLNSALNRGQRDDRLVSLLTTTLPALPSAEYIDELLRVRFEEITGPFCLILDDFHVLRNEIVLAILQQLVSAPPPLLHVVIITREDPPLKFSKLIAQDALSLVRADKLQFSPEEGRLLIEQILGLSLSTNLLQTVLDKTEGWAAALVLCALSLKGKKPEEFLHSIKKLESGYHYLIDYFVEEVLSGLDEQTVSFLAETALLDHLNPDLCDFVTGRKDSGNILKQMHHLNLLLIPLNKENTWFRYHHLFADFLKHRFTTEKENNVLFKKVSEWCSDKGFPLEALYYAGRTKDPDVLIGAFQNAAEHCFRFGSFISLNGMLSYVPESLVKGKPEMEIYRAWTMFFTGDIEHAERSLARLDGAVLERLSDTWRIRAEALNTWTRLISAEIIGGEYRKPKKWLEEEREVQEYDEFTRFVALFTPAMEAFLSNTGGKTCSERFELVLEKLETNEASFFTCLTVHWFAFALFEEGKTDETVSVCKEWVEKISGKSDVELPLYALIQFPLAAAMLRTGDTRQAREVMDYAYSVVSEIRLIHLLYKAGIHGVLSELRRREKAETDKLESGGTSFERKPVEMSSRVSLLSRRELEVLALVAEGRSNREIGEELFISTGTVKWHINNIFEKLEVKSRTGAVRKAGELDLF